MIMMMGTGRAAWPACAGARMIISDHRVLVRLSHCAAATVISPRLIQQLQVRALLVLVTPALLCAILQQGPDMVTVSLSLGLVIQPNSKVNPEY